MQLTELLDEAIALYDDGISKARYESLKEEIYPKVVTWTNTSCNYFSFNPYWHEVHQSSRGRVLKHVSDSINYDQNGFDADGNLILTRQYSSFLKKFDDTFYLHTPDAIYLHSYDFTQHHRYTKGYAKTNGLVTRMSAYMKNAYAKDSSFFWLEEYEYDGDRLLECRFRQFPITNVEAPNQERVYTFRHDDEGLSTIQIADRVVYKRPDPNVKRLLKETNTKLKQLLHDESLRLLEEFRETHQAEDIYAFFYVIGAEGTHIECAIGTLQTLEKAIEGEIKTVRIKKGDPDAVLKQMYRWNPYDGYHFFDLGTVENVINDAIMDGIYERYGKTTEKACLDVLRQLDEEKVFGDGLDREKITIAIKVADYDKLFESIVKKLNPKPVADAVLRDLKVSYNSHLYVVRDLLNTLPG